ncbi:hypothetical protein ILYODFUR_028687, partial [Ilyodon furcidens]
DICPILKSPAALTAVIDLFEERVRSHHQQVDLIVGLDARGFLFGPLLAQRLGVGFVLVRKKGKLPGPTICVQYDLEYGTVKNPSITAQYHAPTTGVKFYLVLLLCFITEKPKIKKFLLKNRKEIMLFCVLLILTKRNILNSVPVIQRKA